MRPPLEYIENYLTDIFPGPSLWPGSAARSIGGHSSHSYMQGTNIYFTFGFMVNEGTESAKRDYMKLISVILEETLKRGGSIARHHGSGKYRTRWMPREHGTSYPLLYKLKEALDPNRILNTGVLPVD